MAIADNTALTAGQSAVDLLIIGGGIMGLWAALHASRCGLKTQLVEKDTLGAGASGGLLGALMPYMPDRWDAKKQFQFDCLTSLETEIAALEAQTRLSAHYHRSGRLVPLPKPHLRRIALTHSRDAQQHWHANRQSYHWHVVDQPPVDHWIDPASGESGFVYDTLAARVAPRALIGVLAAAIRQSPHVQISEHSEMQALDPARGIAQVNGETIAFHRCIIAAGWQSFPWLAQGMQNLHKPLGQPVKGQAALLKADVDPAMPTVFRDGLYIVAHEGGHVAIGSTSENSFAQPLSTDEQLESLIGAARELIPVLHDAPVVERWAGLRPKAIDRDPMVGAHPDHHKLIALTGGFKITFGLAHRLAQAAVQTATGQEILALPPGFTLASHIEVASRS